MLWWLAQNTILAALLAGVVGVICRLVRPRPAVRHALWLIVLIKLVTPPLVHWPWLPPDVWRNSQPETCPTAAKSSHADLPTRELTEWTSPDEVSPADEAPVEQEMIPQGLAREEAGEPALVGQPFEPSHAPLQLLVDANPDLMIPSTQLTAAPGWLDRLAVLAFWSWLAGATVMAIVQLIQILRFRRLRARGMPAPQWLWSQVDELAHGLGVRPPSVLVLPGIGSPMLCSAGRPTLLWPTALLDRLPLDARRAVLVHELAHLRRRDHWVGWLQLLAACLWWWNPLFWHVRRQLYENAELACDAWVVWLLPDDRRAYAEALIEVAQVLSRAVPAPALGIGGGPRQAFERRLVMIMRERVPCNVPLRWLVIIGLLALIALPGWSSGQPAPSVVEEPAPSPKSEPIAPAQASSQPASTSPVTPAPSPTAGASTAQGSPAPPPTSEPVVSPPALNQGPASSLADPEPSPTATPSADRERRLLELERKLDVLLKEVRALRTGGDSSAPATMSSRPPGMPTAHSQPPWASRSLWESKQSRPSAEVVVTLIRATYKLPKEKAEALAAFLRDHVKAQVMETKAEGENLMVTTTPEAQQTIRQFIALLQEKPKPSTPASRP